MARLANKVALVTGGGSGIGRATALTFAREGASVFVADINLAAAQRVAGTIGAQAEAHLLDVTSEPAWEAAVQAAIDRFGKLDIVANIAGIGRGGSIEDTTLEDWHAMIAVNLTGVMLGCKHGIKGIVRSGGAGAIVNMSSMGGIVGPSDIAGYCASKGGVTVLTKSVAMHCAEQRYPIRCVSIHPTYVDTEMLDPVAEAAGAQRADLLAGMARLVPIGRVATPQDIANACLFAASDEAAMISGSGLLVDGAQLAGPPSAHF
ncbi:SDR family NAD(P)-dependent oxidoreductase [Parapedomonas caeni]